MKALCLLLWPIVAAATVFTGEVQVKDAQSLFTPPSDSSPVVLRYYVPDGTVVKSGDRILSIDAGQPAAEIRRLDAEIEQLRATITKEVAELQLKEIDSQIALIDAQAALDAARIDAAIPQSLVSALDFDRYQAELERANDDLALKQKQRSDAQAAVARRNESGRLELQKKNLQRDYDQAQVNAAQLFAERPGVVVHGFGLIFGNGGRYEEGSSSYPGQEVGRIIGNGAKQVQAWVFEADRDNLKVGQKVSLTFDALSDWRASGSISAIAGSPQERKQWGAGRYYTVDIALDGPAPPELKPGMSVRVNTQITEAGQQQVVRRVLAVRKIIATGEIEARTSAHISPPQVEDLWQMSITQMTPEGQPVHAGDVIVSFDAGNIPQQIGLKQNELQEKLRERAKLRLDMADRERIEELAALESQADETKAQRKASVPEALLASVAFKKLVIARRKAEERRKVSLQRLEVARRERGAELNLVEANVQRLTRDVIRMQQSLAALSVRAPRDGIFMHAMGWDGKRIDAGTQIWRGQSVGEIPDLQALLVRADLPERDLQAVRVGQSARILIEGGSGQSVIGHVESLGNVVHSKSTVEPVPVIDLTLAFTTGQAAFRPGTAVRIEIDPGPEKVARR